METLSFNSTNKEIIENLESVTNGQLHCYVVDFENETPGEMIPVGFVQNLTDVPARSNQSSDAFAANDFFSNLLGTPTERVSLRRARMLLTKANANILAKTIGTSISEGVSELVSKNTGKKVVIPEQAKLIVKDTFEPTYASQENAKTKQGEDMISDGKIFYSTVHFVKGVLNKKTKKYEFPAHEVFQVDIGSTPKAKEEPSLEMATEGAFAGAQQIFG